MGKYNAMETSLTWFLSNLDPHGIPGAVLGSTGGVTLHCLGLQVPSVWDWVWNWPEPVTSPGLNSPGTILYPPLYGSWFQNESSWDEFLH